MTGARHWDHITPVLPSLHWLPISERIKYKVLPVTFKAIHGVPPPSYLAALLNPYVTERSLCSAGKGLLCVPKHFPTWVLYSPVFWHAVVGHYIDLPSIKDTGTQIDLAIPDFSKAFDTVPHKRLLSKLEFYCIHGCIVNWITVFLRNTVQSI